MCSSINSTALIHHTTRGVIDLASLLDLNIYVSPTAPIHAKTLAPFYQPVTLDCGSPYCRDVSHYHDEGTGSHENYITSLTIPLPTLPSVRTGKFDELVRGILWDNYLPSSSLSPAVKPAPSDSQRPSFEILRAKGFLRTEDGKCWVLQGVREVYDITEVPSGVGRSGEEVQSKLVLIGRGLGSSFRTHFLSALG